MTITTNKEEQTQKLKIGGIVFTVVYETDIKNSKGRTLYGDISYQTAVIRINSDTDENVQKVTIIHEAIHGILNHAGITKHGEKVIEIIANGIHQVLIDNPDLLKTL
jgi:Zn-dependent peptidase ImmA (M78 family)